MPDYDWQMEIVFAVAGVPVPKIDEDFYLELASDLDAIHLDVIRELGSVNRYLHGLADDVSSDAVRAVAERWSDHGMPSLLALAETLGVLSSLCGQIAQAIMQFKANLTLAAGALATAQIIAAFASGGLTVALRVAGANVVKQQLLELLHLLYAELERQVRGLVAEGVGLDDLADEITRRIDAAVRAAIEEGAYRVGDGIAS